MITLASRSLFLAALSTSAVFAQSATLDEAKAGMRERLAVIDQLKAAGAVGEGMDGRLVLRTPGPETEAAVAAENADRAVLFAELARRGGGTAEAAGREFARQLARASKPGVWLQREDGVWYRK
jgi:uncharacterized protein YdbL (DUF1318 family)